MAIRKVALLRILYKLFISSKIKCHLLPWLRVMWLWLPSPV